MAKSTEVSTTNPAGYIVNNALIDGLSKQIQTKRAYGLTFPADYNPTNELTAAYLVLKETKDKDKKCVLDSCSQTSIANALMTMVTNGLSMNKKQCYPVAFGGSVNLMISVYGYTCMARRYGLKDITAACIYDKDVFKYHISDGEIVIDEHTQNFLNINPDKVLGAYAIAFMQDGSKHVELMNISMIKKAWAKGYGYKDGAGVHGDFPDQMAMKTVKNRCLKYIVRTYGEPDSVALAEQEDVSRTDMIDADVAHDIETNANTEEFVESNIIDAGPVEDAPGENVPEWVD